MTSKKPWDRQVPQHRRSETSVQRHTETTRWNDGVVRNWLNHFVFYEFRGFARAKYASAIQEMCSGTLPIDTPCPWPRALTQRGTRMRRPDHSFSRNTLLFTTGICGLVLAAWYSQQGLFKAVMDHKQFHSLDDAARRVLVGFLGTPTALALDAPENRARRDAEVARRQKL
ncbi:hypothetical protein C8F04DRAFT_1336076 [Mycena alexandri]|uniref:Uncharacterized protein n=1 Tax=Mycena alexandri TaxID=1745969 RepID=A0AAD6X6F9_9AGAR|nr:hypothetical protein C8F04DRAFT_1336076 [Mycena alexandri]